MLDNPVMTASHVATAHVVAFKYHGRLFEIKPIFETAF